MKPHRSYQTTRGVVLDVTEYPEYILDLVKADQYEADEYRLCDFYLTPDDRVLELGCAVGFLMCAFSDRVESWHGFDANLWCVVQASNNIGLNGKRGTVSTAVLSNDKRNKIPFYIREEFFNSSMSPDEHPHSKIIKKVNVDVAPFDLVAESYNTLICDIEGGELDLFTKDINLSTINKIIIELHPKVMKLADIAKILESLFRHGFVHVDIEGDVLYMVRVKR